jgi:hypothetical protein
VFRLQLEKAADRCCPRCAHGDLIDPR